MEDQNPWWTNDIDSTLRKWESSPIRWVPDVVSKIELEPYSLNFLLGPRQVGKTTALKLLVRNELVRRDPLSIYYLSCDRISDHDRLYRELDDYDRARKARGIGSSLVILDEITFVPEWWRAIKARIDMGRFDKDVVILSGSASMELTKGREYFPGRRGKGRDYILLPLSFGDYCRKVRNIDIISGPPSMVEQNMETNLMFSEKLSTLLREYMVTGGFPLSIRDFIEDHTVSTETIDTYVNWLRGDWAKAGRSDQYMSEVIRYLLRAQGTPISWNGISKETSISSANTAKSYVETLQQIFCCHVLELLDPTGRTLHRRNKKIHFLDPLLFRALSEFAGEGFNDAHMFEGTAASHIERWMKTYYWRNSSEVDILIKEDNGQRGYEITMGIKKWKKPWHIRDVLLVDRNNYPLFLASL